MTKQLAPTADAGHLSEIPREIRQTFVQQFEECETEQRQRRYRQAAPLLSADEIDQFNSAVETIADKLGISEELATIDALLQARNTRAARILSAAYSGAGQGL